MAEFNLNSIDWSPLKRGGTNFKTHSLIEVSKNRLEYKATLVYKIFALLFVGIGVALNLAFILIDDFPIFVALFGLVFGGVGWFIYKRGTQPIIFDKSEGFYWKGKSSPSQVNPVDIKIITKLEDIAGIQVIKERVKGDKSSYHSYEINLITDVNERINVVDHGNMNSILSDASIIAKFLEVPVLEPPD